ncbi:MAG: response regulator [Ignavibacteria bacterium]
MEVGIGKFTEEECQNYLILAVDDNKQNLNLMCEFLETEGFRVCKAYNGKSAIKQAKAKKPNLILLDVMMPDIDGIEVSLKIKEISTLNDVPIIFITALDEVSNKVRGFEAGGIDYITKPYQIEDVLTRVKSHLVIYAIRKELEHKNQQLLQEIALRKRTEEALAAAHSQLEDKVKSRTKELKKANRLLLKEITEKKMYEEQLILAKEKAEKSDRIKSEFLAQISHEIRTPINTIFNFTRLLQEELATEANEFQKECFDLIEKAGDRIIRTIELILNMSEIQAGDFEGVFKEIKLGEDMLKKIYPKYLDKALDRNLNLSLTLPEKDCTIVADQYSLEQIFINLIDNAIKYTNSGNIDIKLSMNQQGNTCIIISDTGIGISSEYLQDIFKPFTQEEQGYTRRYEGNGLGLALVYKYCEINIRWKYLSTALRVPELHLL